MAARNLIQDLKLILRQNEIESNELYFERFSSSIYSDEKDEAGDHLVQPFAIEGHKSYSAVFYFYRRPGGLHPSVGICKAKLEAKIDEEDWKTLLEFDFIIGADQDLYILSPHHLDNREFE